MTGSLRARLSILVTAFAVVAATLSGVAPASAASLIEFSGTSPAVQKTVDSANVLRLSAITSGVVVTPGVTAHYQWYRQQAAAPFASVKLTGKTSAGLRLSDADFPYKFWLRVTFTKPGYVTEYRDTVSKDYSLRNAFPFVISADTDPSHLASVGSQLSAGATIFFEVSDEDPTSNMMHEVFPTYGPEAISWYRSASTLVDHGTTYDPRPLDLGKPVTARMVVAFPGYLTYRATTPAVTVVPGNFAGPNWGPEVHEDAPSLVLTASVTADEQIPSTATDDPGPAPAKHWQWYRDGVKIPGATAVTYHLVAADYGKHLSVHVVWTKPGYSTLEFESTPSGYSLINDNPADWSGEPAPGHTLTAALGSFEDTRDGSTVDPGISYQWYRNGVAISGQTGSTYAVTDSDKGKSIALGVIAHLEGLLDFRSTSRSTQVIGTTALAGQGNQNQVPLTLTPESGTYLTVLQAGSTGITETGTTVTYQWYRGTTKISGATKSTFKVTTADRGTQLFVRVTTSKKPAAGVVWTTNVKDSAAGDYGIYRTSDDGVSTPSGRYVGATASVQDGQFSGMEGPFPSGMLTTTYQWLRNGAPIASATQHDYVFQAADVGARISVRVTTAVTGGWSIPLVDVLTTSPATGTVAKGVFTGASDTLPDIVPAGPGKLSVTVDGTGIIPTPTAYAYQWLRGSSAISGATKSTYTLTAADAGKAITVRVTAVRSGYTPAALEVPLGVVHSMLQASPPTILTPNGVKPGDELSVNVPQHNQGDGHTAVPGVVLAYQWYRNGVALSTAKSATYIIVAADLNKKLTVRVTATAPGYLAKVDPVSAPVTVVNPLAGSHAIPTATKADDGTLLTAALPSGSITTPGAQLSYQWLRDGAAISGATSVTYQPTAPADSGMPLSVRVTATKAGFETVVLVSLDINVSVTPVGSAVTSENPQLGDVLEVSDTSYTLGGPGGPAYVPAGHDYQWFVGSIQVSTASTYAPVEADIGKVITLKVVTSKPGWLDSVQSFATNPVTE